MEVVTIPLDLISIGKRLREVDYDHVGTLAESIAKVGLINPITVVRGKVSRGDFIPDVPGYWIVAGAHRFHACRSLGLVEISAHVVEMSDLERDLVEIDENLAGPVLSKQDLYIFTHRRKVIYETLYPETKIGGAPGIAGGGKAAKEVKVRSFVDDHAKKTGVSRATVARNARRGAVLDNEAMQVIRGSGLDDGRNLDAVARLPVAAQREVAALVASHNIDEARRMLYGELDEMRKIRKAERDLVRAWNETKDLPEARENFAERYRGELERAIGVHPKLRSKPKLKIVDSEGA